MKKDLTEKDGRLILLLTLLGAFAAVVMIPYQKEIGLLDILIETYHITFTIAAIINAIQVTIYTLIASAIGLHLARPVGFNVSYLRGLVYKNKTVPLSLKWIMIAILGSAVGTLIIAVLEVKVFQPHLVTQLVPNVSLWKIGLLMFYGGIVEEILLRLFLLTLIVWICSISYRKQSRPIPKYIYWIAILVSTLLFGLGHLPATATVFGEITSLLFIRATVLNGLMGVFFGYLFWKKGLEYAIIAHMLGDVFLHVVWHSLFT
ncbi:CPBP family intramembrane glutamic endopeptidase [Metabacillus schmidteae]|uniref:CPBP family intramembrane glutamic endopeptidase n=1 Tax=Metabacillus schmidteae TaxID=2730405 RepID=UPI00158B2387|nr:CPBP family intramembrane glutamic endopeptidase [Metabacillus schmidteae]